jgi:hypothetical protein
MWTRLLFIAASLVAPLTAFACSPVQSIDVFFSRNSARVSAEQVLRLANWTAVIRQNYPNRQSIDFAANAEQGESDAKNLALARARNVARVLLEDLQFNAPSINPPLKGNVFPAGAPGREDVKRVEIDFLPACPHECPCQTGDPLHKPSTSR